MPEDHPWHYATMRSTAFREADCILILGTRLNYIVGHAAPPRFNADARIVRIDIDQTEIAQSPAPHRHRHRGGRAHGARAAHGRH